MTTSEFAIRLSGVGKMYKIFPTRLENLFDAIGLNRIMPFRTGQYREFWAVRDVDLELRHGQRLGVIGRNGAGKSTLLKMITGAVAPTEGAIEVDGKVQALFDAGAGLHPEFTGRENVRASLTYQGLGLSQIREVEAEIGEFTELGEFLDQPFRTYSLGMQARLGFAIATAIRPEILIVDEVLGAGDAYFFSKSTARMTQLVEGGASVLLVSHSLQHVMRFCDETVWMDRGRVVMRGPTMEVVKAYEKYVRVLESRQLKAKNEKVKASPDAFERESYSDEFLLRLDLTGRGTELDVAEVRLVVDGTVEDSVKVGDTQDADPLHAAFVILENESWSAPLRDESVTFRRLKAAGGSPGSAVGHLLFRLWFLYPNSEYAFDVTYRLRGQGAEFRTGRASDDLLDRGVLPPADDWRTERLALTETVAAAVALDPEHENEGEDGRTIATDRSRWPGRPGLSISDVRLLDASGDSQVIVSTGDPMAVDVTVVVETAERLPLYLAVLVFRDDGLVTTRHVSHEISISGAPGDRLRARLDFGELLLGNGTYFVSVGLYSKLDVNDIEPSEVYDYLDRSYEFRVVGNPALHNEIVRHPGSWSFRDVTSATAPIDASEGAPGILT